MGGDPFAGNGFGVVTMDDDFFKGRGINEMNMKISDPIARKIFGFGMTDDDFS